MVSGFRDDNRYEEVRRQPGFRIPVRIPGVRSTEESVDLCMKAPASGYADSKLACMDA